MFTLQGENLVLLLANKPKRKKENKWASITANERSNHTGEVGFKRCLCLVC